ncbi:MAG: hypothetical protein ACREVE_17095 [Gammaproteobacteria bacterium]
MNTKWMLGLLAMSGFASAAGWQDSQEITEYLIDGADTGEKMMVGFEFAPNPDGNGDPGLAHVDGSTAKGKYLFSIILSAHSAKQPVAPKFDGCDPQGRPILTGLRVVSK